MYQLLQVNTSKQKWRILKGPLFKNIPKFKKKKPINFINLLQNALEYKSKLYENFKLIWKDKQFTRVIAFLSLEQPVNSSPQWSLQQNNNEITQLESTVNNKTKLLNGFSGARIAIDKCEGREGRVPWLSSVFVQSTFYLGNFI